MALDGNTVDLGDAIGSVYGDEAKTGFLELWRNHIGFFVDYTVATAKKDEAGQTAARDKLAQYQADFSAFLDTATGGELPQSGAAEALQAHVNQLIARDRHLRRGRLPRRRTARSARPITTCS